MVACPGAGNQDSEQDVHMTSQDFGFPDADKLIQQMIAGASPDQLAAMFGGVGDALNDYRRPEPKLLPVPATTRGFRIRIDLQRTKPPVWRRIEVAGDMLMPRLHEVIQAAMGWTDSHLHRFRTGHERNAPELLTQFDLDEGDEGMLEDGVRLDQLVAKVGDRLWYDYDFGDGWGHILRVEEVLEEAPAVATCVAGKLACPPEDCGGPWGYTELADWVRGGFAEELRPEVFESAREAKSWLPEEWHPDVFDLAEANSWVSEVSREAGPVGEELSSLLNAERRHGIGALRARLALPSSAGGTEVGADAADRLTAPFRVLLEVVGDGVPLTSAGYLKPAHVEEIARRTGVSEWWIGMCNREDQTWPVAQLRNAARSLGLVAVRKGRMVPTRAGQAVAGDPQALLAHIQSWLPLGSAPHDRHSGWSALAVVGSESRAEEWRAQVSEVLFSLGWRDGSDHYSAPPAESKTMGVLELLAGATRAGRRLRGVDADVAAFARGATRRI